jgi:hypothetical protein
MTTTTTNNPESQIEKEKNPLNFSETANGIQTEKKFKQSLRGVSGGLQMLYERKAENMDALAELSIILLDDKVRNLSGLDDPENKIYNFLSAVRFLLSDVNKESVKFICDSIDELIEK